MGAIFLVRHGQASFGTHDYDRLSALGVRQSRVLGAALAEQGLEPGRILAGRMRRHAQTAAAVVEGAGWEHEATIEPAWDEFDLLSLVQGRVEGEAATNSRAFQEVIESAMREWAGGGPVNDGGESFAAFDARVQVGLERIVTEPIAAGPTLIATSAGAISWVVTTLLDGGIGLWIRLNRVCINAAVTKVVYGRSGVSLVSFNEHGHLLQSDVTYR